MFVMCILVGKTSIITRFMYDSFDNTYQVRQLDVCAYMYFTVIIIFIHSGLLNDEATCWFQCFESSFHCCDSVRWVTGRTCSLHEKRKSGWGSNWLMHIHIVNGLCVWCQCDTCCVNDHLHLIGNSRTSVFNLILYDGWLVRICFRGRVVNAHGRHVQ